MQFEHASNRDLLHQLDAVVGSHRRITAELVLCLAEVDARRLHVEVGCPSLFAYCVGRLRFSEDEACRRIEAARLARRFPYIIPLLERGAVSLTTLGLLKHHLTDENAHEVLAGISGVNVRRAREWLAARFPSPDVPSTIRKLPGALVTKRSRRRGSHAHPATNPDQSPGDGDDGRLQPRRNGDDGRDLTPAPRCLPSLHIEHDRAPAHRSLPSRDLEDPAAFATSLSRETHGEPLAQRQARAST